MSVFKLKSHTFVGCFVSLLLGANVSAAASHPIDIGQLTDYYSTQGNGDRYYQFTLSTPTTVSIFLNGLSAGYQMQLIDDKRRVIATGNNQGTNWQETGSTTFAKAIIADLNAGTYYVNVTSALMKGNPQYRSKNFAFILNLIPDNAPHTIVVAASDSPMVGHPQFITNGANDEELINQALKQVATQGAGRVLLRPGTYTIHDNILVSYDDITLMGSGWSTVLKVGENSHFSNRGLIRADLTNKSLESNKLYFNKQVYSHFSVDGSKSTVINVSNLGAATFGTYKDSHFGDIRIHDMGGHGFNVNNHLEKRIASQFVTISDSLVDHNSEDGAICDASESATIANSIIDANGGYGVEMRGGADSIIENLTITNNQLHGIFLHENGATHQEANRFDIHDNEIVNNGGDGIYLHNVDTNNIKNNIFFSNGMHGIELQGAGDSMVQANKLIDNGQKAESLYCGIYMGGNSERFSTANTINKNIFYTKNPSKYQYGLAESDERENYNQVVENTFTNVANPIRLLGPNSVQKKNKVN